MKITKDNLTIANVRSYIRGNSTMIAQDIGIKALEDHELIQVELRKILCNDCFENGKCFVCNCKTPNLFYDTQRIDSKKRWGVMLNKEEWDLFTTEVYNKSKEYSMDDLAKEYSAYYNSKKNTNMPKSVKKINVISNAPKLEIVQLDIPKERLHKNFGNIKQHENTDYTFSFKNTTTYPIKIDSINTSCGCTSSNFTDQIAKPNEYLFFTVKYDSSIIGHFKKMANPRLSVIGHSDKLVSVPPFVIEGVVSK